MSNNSINIRELITEILLSVDKREEHSHILLASVLDKYDYLPQNDKNFIKRVVTGTLDYRVKIDYVINQFSKTPVNKMKPLIRNLMRMSVYQILYMDKVPDSAVCNEAVKLAGKRGFKGLQGFVNGVLRSIARGKDEIKWPEGQGSQDVSVNYSCPELIVKSLIDDYGVENTKSLLGYALEDSGISVRLDESLTEDEKNKVLAEWDEAGIEYSKSSLLNYAYRLRKADKLAKLKGFENGHYTVQDISSMFVCELAGIKAGDTILDICAAPGGKTLHAACKLKCAQGVTDAKGVVYSRDVSDYKVALIEDNIDRLGVDNVVCQVQDARVLDESMIDKADVCIADVPCSGFGVIGKKPDIKYNITEEGLSSILVLQRDILDNAVRYVKPGGVLMFSTCTMRKQENEDNVEYILKKGGFTLEESKQFYISEETDGFFVARIRKDNQ